MTGGMEVKYSEVVSGDVAMNMMVMLGGGSKAHMDIRTIFFQNDRCSYPIQGVPENVPGIAF